MPAADGLRLAATHTTAAARAWLAAGGPARVLNAFDHACNLVNTQGQVLALISSARGLTPFGLAVEPGAALPFAAVEARSQVKVEPGALGIGPVTIDLGAAQVWDARPAWLTVSAALAQRPALFDRLAALAAELAPSGSLLELVVGPEAATLAPAFRDRARAGAVDLVSGLSAGDWARAEAGVSRLAGLGGGLTPAGDDFVLGVCLAAHAGAYGPAAVSHLPALADALSPRTTTLSAAYVSAAARGECASYWHDVFAALTEPGGPAETSPAAVGALVNVGHTSGADGLAGFVARSRLRLEVDS